MNLINWLNQVLKGFLMNSLTSDCAAKLNIISGIELIFFLIF